MSNKKEKARGQDLVYTVSLATDVAMANPVTQQNMLELGSNKVTDLNILYSKM